MYFEEFESKYPFTYVPRTIQLVVTQLAVTHVHLNLMFLEIFLSFSRSYLYQECLDSNLTHLYLMYKEKHKIRCMIYILCSLDEKVKCLTISNVGRLLVNQNCCCESKFVQLFSKQLSSIVKISFVLVARKTFVQVHCKTCTRIFQQHILQMESTEANQMSTDKINFKNYNVFTKRST